MLGIQSVKTTALRPLEPLERDMVSVYDLLYDSLITIDDNYLPQPGLCESWEQGNNGKTWTFHLRSGVTFSDGTPLTAQDVVATAQHILDRANDEGAQDKGYYANLNYFVDKITATNDTTVTIRAKRSYWGLLYALTFPILPAAYVTADNPPGTGAYVVSTFEPSNYLWLQANANWWQNLPQVREIMIICHNTPGAVIESYEYARVDAIFTRSVSAAQYRNQLETLLMNHSASKLSSINVRKAIRYAIDVDKIAATVYMGMVKRTDTPAIPGSWMYNNNLGAYFVTDPDAARTLLSEDGWYDSNEDGILDRVDGKGELEKLSLRLDVYEEPDNNVRVEAASPGGSGDRMHRVGTHHGGYGKASESGQLRPGPDLLRHGRLPRFRLSADEKQHRQLRPLQFQRHGRAVQGAAQQDRSGQLCGYSVQNPDQVR